MTSTSSSSAPVPTCSGRRIPPAHANRFDGEAMPIHHHASSHNQSAASVNTSISSVSTEPHTAEPTPRRRVHSPPAPIFDAVKPADRSSSANALSVTSAAIHRVASQGTSPVNTSTTGSPVRKNNPYMYNVLGEHASPDFASRTSPIPNDALNQTAASSITTSPTFPPSSSAHHPHRHSFDWDEVQQMQHDAAATGSPVLGSYMAQCYSSAFPPGHLPKPMAQDGSPKSTKSSAQREPGTGRRRGRRGGSNSPHNSSTATVATAATAASPAAVAPAPTAAPAPKLAPVAPQPRAAAPAPPAADADAAMTRVYRNGRPVPVPTAATCAH